MPNTLEIPSRLGSGRQAQEIPSKLGPIGPSQPDPSNVAELPQAELPIRSQQPLQIDFNRLVDIIAQEESSDNPRAKGKAGELGMFQIKPSLAAHYGVSAQDLFDPVKSRMLATTILSQYARKYHGDLAKTLSAWNAGEPRTDKGEIPLSTHNYINKFVNLYNQSGVAYAGEDAGERPPGPSGPSLSSGRPPSARVGKVGGLHPLEEYGNFETLKQDWMHTRTYRSYSSAKQTQSFDRLYKAWVMARADRPDPTAGIAGSDSNLDFVGRANKAISDYATSLAGGPGSLGGQIAGGVVSYGLPNSWTQLAIDGALFIPGLDAIKPIQMAVEAAPEVLQPVARLGARLGLPTALGAIGGGLSGQGAKQGAIQGAVSGAVGEVGSLALGLGKRGIQRLDVGRLGNWLSRFGIDLEGNKEADAISGFIGDGAENMSKTRLGKATADVGQALTGSAPKVAQGAIKRPPQALLTVNIPHDLAANPDFIKSVGFPPGSMPIDWQTANHVLDTVEKIGWDPHFRSVNTHAAQAARSAAGQIQDDVYYALERQVGPKQARQWLGARKQLQVSRIISNLFRQPGVVEGDHINIRALQAALNTGGPGSIKEELNQVVGQAQAQELVNSVFRGSRSGRLDKAGNLLPSLSISGHAHMWIHPKMPELHRHVGYLPYNLGRGRALFAATMMGPENFVARLARMFGQSGPSSAQGEPNASASQP